jgi:hypothetical protein
VYLLKVEAVVLSPANNTGHPIFILGISPINQIFKFHPQNFVRME